LSAAKAFYFWRRVPADLVGTFIPKIKQTAASNRVSLVRSFRRRGGRGQWPDDSRSNGRSVCCGKADARPAPAFSPFRIARLQTSGCGGARKKTRRPTPRVHPGQLQRLTQSHALILSKRGAIVALGRTDTIGKQLEAFADFAGLACETSPKRGARYPSIAQTEIRAITAISRGTLRCCRSTEAISAPAPAKVEARRSARGLRQVEPVEAPPPRPFKLLKRRYATSRHSAKDVPLHALTREGCNAVSGAPTHNRHEDRQQGADREEAARLVKTLLKLCGARPSMDQAQPLVRNQHREDQGKAHASCGNLRPARTVRDTAVTKYAIRRRRRRPLTRLLGPLLGAFTGARISEIAQLRIEMSAHQGRCPISRFGTLGKAQPQDESNATGVRFIRGCCALVS